MGANLTYRKFPDSLGRGNITIRWANAVQDSRHEDGVSYSGEIGMLLGPIKWRDQEFTSEDEADAYISEMHEKGDNPMAVSFNEGGEKWWIIGGWSPC